MENAIEFIQAQSGIMFIDLFYLEGLLAMKGNSIFNE